MNIRSKINPKNIGDRTPLTGQTKNLPAVIKPDYSQVRSKDILLRDRSRDNLPATYKKPIPKSPMPKSTSFGLNFFGGTYLTGKFGTTSINALLSLSNFGFIFL